MVIGITVQADLRVHTGELGDGEQVVGGDIDLGAGHADLLDQVLVCDPVLKTEKNKVYVERLLSEGGAAVDSMNKIIGPEKTGELIRKFMYHTVD